jgi:phage anti-repressor protein
MNFAEFLKSYSNIDNNFIDEYLNIYDNDNNDIFIVNLENIAFFLETPKGDLKKTLLNSYELNKDYIVKKIVSTRRGARNEEILLTVKCFKNFCMHSKTKKAIKVREYYCDLEELTKKYLQYTIKGLLNN